MDINAQDPRHGYTALMMAARSRRKDRIAIVKELLALGADVKRSDKQGQTARDHAHALHLDDIEQLLTSS